MICKRYSRHLRPMRERPSNFDFGLLPFHILDFVHQAKTWKSRHSLSLRQPVTTDISVDVLLTLLAGFVGRLWGLAGSRPIHTRKAKTQNPLYPSVFQRESSGRGGIRTHGWFNPTLDFESSALDRTQPPFLLLLFDLRDGFWAAIGVSTVVFHGLWALGGASGRGDPLRGPS